MPRTKTPATTPAPLTPAALKTYVQTSRGRFSRVLIKAKSPLDQPLVESSLSHHCRLCTLAGKQPKAIRTTGNMRRHLLTQHRALIQPVLTAADPNVISKKSSDDSTSSKSSSDSDSDSETDTELEIDDDDDPADKNYVDGGEFLEKVNKDMATTNEQLNKLKNDIAANNKKLEAVLAQLKKTK